MSEKDRAIECIKALSRIEGFVARSDESSSFFEENLDLLLHYFEEKLENDEETRREDEN